MYSTENVLIFEEERIMLKFGFHSPKIAPKYVSACAELLILNHGAYGAVFTNVHTLLQCRLLKVPILPDPRIRL